VRFSVLVDLVRTFVVDLYTIGALEFFVIRLTILIVSTVVLIGLLAVFAAGSCGVVVVL